MEAIREMIAHDRGGFNTPEVYQLQKGIHPDVEVLSAPADKEIGVEPVRDLLEKAQSFPTAGPHRFFVIDGADRLSVAAGNALLKTLEEPPAASRFYLLAESNDRVLPTIRSRCGRVPFRRLPESFVLSKLSSMEKDPTRALLYTRMAEGSAGKAIRYWGANRIALRDLTFSVLQSCVSGDLGSALALVDEVGEELSLAIKLFRFLLHDMLLLSVDPERLINVDLHEGLVALHGRCRPSVWSRFSAELRQVETRNESAYINLHFHLKTALVSTFVAG